MYAVSRIMLNNWIPNLQASWVKEGPKLAQMALDAGCNDFMGTLINESISTSAGAIYGQRMAPREMRALIREMGRIPAERNTLYGIMRSFGIEQDDHYDPLDLADGSDERFGSYIKLTQTIASSSRSSTSAPNRWRRRARGAGDRQRRVTASSNLRDASATSSTAESNAWVFLRRGAIAADFAHVLQRRRADLLLGRRLVIPPKRLDASAHAHNVSQPEHRCRTLNSRWACR